MLESKLYNISFLEATSGFCRPVLLKYFILPGTKFIYPHSDSKFTRKRKEVSNRIGLLLQKSPYYISLKESENFTEYLN